MRRVGMYSTPNLPNPSSVSLERAFVLVTHQALKQSSTGMESFETGNGPVDHNTVHSRAARFSFLVVPDLSEAWIEDRSSLGLPLHSIAKSGSGLDGEKTIRSGSPTRYKLVRCS